MNDVARVFNMADFRERTSSKRPGIYVWINERNIVEYGMGEVSEKDNPRLLKAMLLLGIWLMELQE